MKRVLLAAAVVLAAVAVLTLMSLPPRRVDLAPAADGSIPGVIHIHTNRSDGRSSPEEIARVAARAGLKFIVFTDHGDATRPPDPPAYRQGVLCIDAVEISTTGGHYVALDLPAAPYPLAGEPRDIVEDVKRLGGFGYAAHPDSPKADLRWRDWSLPMDGMEIVNPDTSWRVRALDPGWRPKLRLFAALFTYPFRPEETIAGLLTDSPENIARWDSFTSRRKFVGLAGADAHDKLAPWNVDPGDNRYSLPLPGYEASFRTQSVHVSIDAPLSGNAREDAAAILRGVRAGHVYMAVDALASPPSLEFTAENGKATAHEGDAIAPGLPITLRVKTNAPASFSTTVWRGRDVLKSGQRQEMTIAVPGDPATYRVDVRASDRRTQPEWLLSNPIYVQSENAPEGSSQASPAAARETTVLFDGRGTAGWRTEGNPESSGQVDLVTDPQGPAGPGLRFRYRLSSDPAPIAALLVETAASLAGTDRLTFRARADRPMRLSVQVRTSPPDTGPEERWHRSVYLDETDRDVTVSFGEMTPIGTPRTPEPALAKIRDLLFVVDTTNSKPGASGQVTLTRVALQR